jgi:hypothetical protein
VRVIDGNEQSDILQDNSIPKPIRDVLISTPQLSVANFLRFPPPNLGLEKPDIPLDGLLSLQPHSSKGRDATTNILILLSLTVPPLKFV